MPAFAPRLVTPAVVLFGEREARLPPDPPTLDTATPGVDSIDLAWTPGAAGSFPITGYKLYRGVHSGAEHLRATLGLVTSTTDLCEQVRTYFYKVTALSAAGESARSNELAAVPLPEPFVLTPVSPGSFTLTPVAPLTLSPLEPA